MNSAMNVSAEKKVPHDKKFGRYDTSLGLLTKKFVSLLREAPEGVLDLNSASGLLNVPKRRIYDITNVLEGINLIEKRSKNNIQWKGRVGDQEKPEEPNHELVAFRENVLKLAQQEKVLDDHIDIMHNSLKSLAEDIGNIQKAYVTHSDIRCIPSLKDETVITVKAPPGTKLEVPDPDCGIPNNQKPQFQIYLKSTSGPIDVYLVSGDKPEGSGHQQQDEQQNSNHDVLYSSSQQNPQQQTSFPNHNINTNPNELGSNNRTNHHYNKHPPQGLSNTNPNNPADNNNNDNAYSTHHHQLSSNHQQAPISNTAAAATTLGGLVRLNPPPVNTDYLFNLDDTEGIADFYDFAGTDAVGVGGLWNSAPNNTASTPTPTATATPAIKNTDNNSNKNSHYSKQQAAYDTTALNDDSSLSTQQ